MPVLALVLLLASLQHAASSGDGQFAYDGFAGESLALDGAARVAPNGLLVLTNGTVAMTGHALHPAPFRFREQNSDGTVRSFSTAFVFAIVSPHLHLSSHGLAFFVSRARSLSNTMPFQYLGLLNTTDGGGSASNHILAVELDTVLNYEFADINNNHVGIDVDSLRSVAAASAGYYEDGGDSVFRDVSLFSREAMQVWVDYDGRTTVLDVTLAPLGVPKPKRPLLSRAVDLSAAVPEEAYVGFSSSTGVMACSHYVLGWSFGLDSAAPPLNVSRLPDFPHPNSKPKRKLLPIVLPIAAFAAAAVVAVAAVLVFVRRRLDYVELREDWEAEFGAHRFAYKDLHRATNGFTDKRLIGKGGCGEVYKGVLPRCKTEVAVKRVSGESRQGMMEFVAEVASMGRLRHRNLVPLLGYCRRKGELLLVYKCMRNGSLEKFLYDQGKITLCWDQRFGIIKDIASGLFYLHEEWEQVIVHRDIKPSNVLLDDEMNGRLGDFGLARLYDHGTNSYTTRVVGTTGYLAPELMRTGKASPATDVFAFGAFLLEIVCGRRPVEQGMEGETFVLEDHVLGHWHNGSLMEAVDSKLQGDYGAEEVCLTLKLGLLCLHPLPGARPSMRQVVQYLDGGAAFSELVLTNLNERAHLVSANKID
ncbi:L-type lectin-domain containing receptor kinase SIT2-like [Phragmites australis]|uniref:L-type lectin-domain containing receptor kinase SIT2-like n=1 Tax=Phragmites australis TaxID=29695 RepID=UPI002D790EAA|nr:L-type lectin-domain containing receptor kinase SIT2-like [Phragmites australis]